MNIKIETRAFPLKEPFVITGYTFTDADAIMVTLEKDGLIGRGEATGIYYEDETPASMTADLEKVINDSITQVEVNELLPRGGALNAIDCAFWDLRCKIEGRSVFDILNISPKPLSTVATVSIETPENMAKKALFYAKYPNLKIKLSADAPIERLEAIREARPDATLITDVNQGWTFAELKEYTPHCKRLGLAMIEQPLARGDDAELEGYKSEVPLGADESCLDSSEYDVAAKRYDIINIKLDKCGGLTDALKITQYAKRDGKGLMVGNMTGSSLSMAPSYVVGQYCDFIDLDGPLFLTKDVEHALTYADGGIVSQPTKELWG
ncbi:MAG: dipeptide epimerase [Kordiimonadaceae bacterium]|jgi:L-Ala-D/L-Glu epimerase|nr:dipeptide epimerase [Kordiimonadaceae bacterium]MBT6035272.1 dipeptide epimerase [Kordiimonadaceae bacterium]MBT6330898.1 dipeptide epimerase [Kordiimonadaceae bacterium]MBT7583087.1 dipeptide epimerase [Kordiimonadaceae bacterium]